MRATIPLPLDVKRLRPGSGRNITFQRREPRPMICDPRDRL